MGTILKRMTSFALRISMEDRIFRQYDIRGIFGKDLTVDMAERIGRGYATYFTEETIPSETQGEYRQ